MINYFCISHHHWSLLISEMETLITNWLPIRSFGCLTWNSYILPFEHWGLIDATWHHGTWWTLVHVTACCLFDVPSHYLNQCWLISNGDILEQNSVKSIRNCIWKCFLQRVSHFVEKSIYWILIGPETFMCFFNSCVYCDMKYFGSGHIFKANNKHTYITSLLFSDAEWYHKSVITGSGENKLEQLECLHFEDTPTIPWLPILLTYIRSQVTTRQSHSYKFKEFTKISNFWILKKSLPHLLKLLD